MNTWHIHIKGIVQGVGFRPFVYKLAVQKKIKGWVNNTSDGVHIEFNASEQEAERFLEEILENLPPLAVVTSSELYAVDKKEFSDFRIIQSENKSQVDLLILPDIAMCKDCREELFDEDNRRFQYPFITCTNCGPRYSIMSDLPYDRPNTTMAGFEMCDVCLEEYNNPLERRHYSQTNSCSDCPVEMQLYENGILKENFTDLDYIVEAWKEGKIVAIKGIGGFLLTCDATNEETIRELRRRKNRPNKPFALMYHDVYELAEDVHMQIGEKILLESKEAPIVLLYRRDDPMTQLAFEQIAPGLETLGVMLPYTPLYDILLKKFKKPIIATSANLTNDIIVYRNEEAIKKLSGIADLILLNNRDIVVTQDDSLARMSFFKQKPVLLRRSRGYAPTYILPDLKIPEKSILATGAMLKSTFSLSHRGNIFVSQYLGNTDYYEAQVNYEDTYKHLSKLIDFTPEYVVTDKHPAYYSTGFGEKISQTHSIPFIKVQHHEAHFMAVLAENDLLDIKKPVLGVIWDGTGYGHDGNIWGGEFFIYREGRIDRYTHLDYYPFVAGDKMVREPRISLLSLTRNFPDDSVCAKFSGYELKIYKKLIENSRLQTSSIGRLFDAASSLILGVDKQTYEGEAAIRLENAAYKYFKNNNFTLHYSYLENKIPENFSEYLIFAILEEKNKGFDPDFLAAKFHITLAHYIQLIVNQLEIEDVALSGGVFQNVWLLELIESLLDEKVTLHLHKNLSPNDESISFGQLMYFFNMKNNK